MPFITNIKKKQFSRRTVKIKHVKLGKQKFDSCGADNYDKIKEMPVLGISKKQNTDGI